MARQKRLTPASKRTVVLPDDCWEYLDTLDFDPVRQRPRYGSRARTLERMVREAMSRDNSIRQMAQEGE